MIPVPSGVQVWLATGHTDMRKGFDGLALLVQETLRRNPHNGHLFVFRGRRGSLAHYLGHRNLQKHGPVHCTCAGEVCGVLEGLKTAAPVSRSDLRGLRPAQT
jgi:transposase